MSNPEETNFEEAFTELGESAELIVEPVGAAVIRGRVRRRRTTRVVVAAVAALALIAPATWMIQQAATADETPQIADDTTVETTPDEAPETSRDPAPSTETETSEPAPPPGYADLLGQTITLPPFGDDNRNDPYCPFESVELTESGGEPGQIYLIKVVHARLTAGGPLEAVALIGCSPSDAMVRNALVIGADGDGGFEVTDELFVVDDDHGSLYDIAPDAEYGVLFQFLSEEPCCATKIEDVDRWIERYRDGGSEEMTGEVPGTYVTDLEISVEVDTSQEGTWVAAVTVTNLGATDASQFAVNFCSSESVRLEGEQEMSCEDNSVTIETVDGLAPGETYETTLTMQVGPEAEWSAGERVYGPEMVVRVNMPSYLIDALVLETAWGNNAAQHLGEIG